MSPSRRQSKSRGRELRDVAGAVVPAPALPLMASKKNRWHARLLPIHPYRRDPPGPAATTSAQIRAVRLPGQRPVSSSPLRDLGRAPEITRARDAGGVAGGGRRRRGWGRWWAPADGRARTHPHVTRHKTMRAPGVPFSGLSAPPAGSPADA